MLPDVYTIQVSAVYGDKPLYASEVLTVGAVGIANLSLTALPSIDVTGSVPFSSFIGKKARVRVDLSPETASVERLAEEVQAALYSSEAG